MVCLLKAHPDSLNTLSALQLLEQEKVKVFSSCIAVGTIKQVKVKISVTIKSTLRQSKYSISENFIVYLWIFCTDIAIGARDKYQVWFQLKREEADWQPTSGFSPANANHK